METRLPLNKQMGELNQSILRMGALVEEALNKALEALRNEDSNLAAKVVEEDKVIDQLHLEIEDAATQIIALEQPVATDLREIMTVAKIAGDLERIGDHARHIAKAVDRLPSDLIVAALPGIDTMAQMGIGMVHDALSAFVAQDPEAAGAVAARDDLVDDAHRAMYANVIAIMRDKPEWLEHGVSLMFLNRYLERLGDHVTNICEWVVFAKTGVHVELNK